MKATKIFGAVALSAALAIGTAVPAFAVDPVDPYDEYPKEESGAITGGVGAEVTDTTNQADGSSISTDIYVKSRVSQLNVAVPLKIGIVADTEHNVMAPSAGLKSQHSANCGATDCSDEGKLIGITGYRIQNGSSFPILIDNVAVTENGDDWKLKKDFGATGNEDYAPSAGAKIGDLALTLKPTGNTEGNREVKDGHDIYSGINEGDQAATKNTEVNLFDAKGGSKPGWIVKGGTADSPSILGLELKGNASDLKNIKDRTTIATGTDPNYTYSGDFSVTYTVKATSLSA